MSERLTIVLSGRAPVNINPDDWPVIASAKTGVNRNGDWNRRRRLWVRQHADRRTLVYGTYETCWENETGHAAGVLLASDAELIPAIRQVGSELGDEDLIAWTIADLPPVDLD